MDFLNIYNIIYFIWDKLKSVFIYNEDDPVTSLDISIRYYQEDPEDLFNSIMSSDISLIEVNTASLTLKEYTNMLRNITYPLSKGITLTGFIAVKEDTIYLKDFLFSNCSGDLKSELEAFFNMSKGFLNEYKKLTPKDTNYRLVSSLASNVIYLSEVFSSLDIRV